MESVPCRSDANKCCRGAIKLGQVCARAGFRAAFANKKASAPMANSAHRPALAIRRLPPPLVPGLATPGRAARTHRRSQPRVVRCPPLPPRAAPLPLRSPAFRLLEVGLPLALCVDYHSFCFSSVPEALTQLGTALRYAPTPQAKGKIERASIREKDQMSRSP